MKMNDFKYIKNFPFPIDQKLLDRVLPPTEEFRYICSDPLSMEPTSRLCTIEASTEHEKLVKYQDGSKQWVSNDCVTEARIVEG